MKSGVFVKIWDKHIWRGFWEDIRKTQISNIGLYANMVMFRNIYLKARMFVLFKLTYLVIYGYDIKTYKKSIIGKLQSIRIQSKYP